MTRRQLSTLATLGLIALVATPALSCTTVCLMEKGQAIVAYNYDFHPPEGLILVNKRGVRKTSALRAQGATWEAAHAA